MASKPMHEYYASYDLYAMIESRQKCLKLKTDYEKCRNVFPNDNIGVDYCRETLKKLSTFCNYTPPQPHKHD